ncbi:hypothetical protein GCK72_020863 [Caenorhabditis remanei]|uniref:Peptidase C1A papain C-terminal domain-containing protein n=1 Tax=Caenorhabditis remanei TaxID=31234 RepID=A0A6A5GHZ7_CAERE|nr:hypothetical protein GCK72_020863 [Caenorhabditis remanei]KAF1754303.1 hypothetical protein GCK72_020863 [Caenorhabditis remanei]
MEVFDDFLQYTTGIYVHLAGNKQGHLSTSHDARERWPECSSIPLINDISECKSSWAFAAAESMSDRLCINSGGMIDTILSAQELLSCCTGVLSCGEGCAGGNPFKAWQYWQKHGLPTGGSYESQFGCKPYSIAPCGKTIGNVTYPPCTNTTLPTPTCEKKCKPGCAGGNPFKAWQYWQKHGLPTGGSYESQFGCKPYSIAPCGKTIGNVTYPPCTNTTLPTPTCEKKCKPGYPVDLDKDRHYGVSVDQLPNRQIEIQSDVMLNGPVEATMEIYDDFLQYTTGIYVHLAGNKQGHLSVRILGWGMFEGVPYWLLANSWGKEWGENGTFRVLRGVNECGLEANCISGMPKLS